MMLLKKVQSVVRFQLVGTKPFDGEGWRDRVRDELEDAHFRDDGPVEERRTGFVDPWHLGTVTFSDHNRWMFEPYLVIGFRIDRRTVPKNLFDATLSQRVEAWCAERAIERCPAAVRSEMKDALKKEWLKRVLPKVKHLQISIDTRDGSAHLFGSASESDCDQLRKAVFRLLGAKLVPWEQAAFSVDGDPSTLMPLLLRACEMGPVRVASVPNDGAASDDGGSEE